VSSWQKAGGGGGGSAHGGGGAALSGGVSGRRLRRCSARLSADPMGGDEGWPDCAISERCAEAIHKAKKEIRSELKPASWSRRGYWRPGAKELPQELDNLQRIHCRDVTPEQFFERFELPARPVVIDGFAEGTPAQHWTAESLLQKYGEMRFKCGEDDEGYPERVKLRHFMEYCTTEGQMDDSPLYVFDSRFADRGDGKTLLNDYRLP
jgi:histone arginine demethylase JMJD6